MINVKIINEMRNIIINIIINNIIIMPLTIHSNLINVRTSI